MTDETASARHGHEAGSGDGAAPAGEVATSAGDGAAPAGEDVTPAGDAAVADGAVIPAEGAGDGLDVVYCGGCNPHIDRAAVAAEVRQSTGARRRGTLYLSGCPRACASDHRLAADDTSAAVVAGAHVDGVPTEPGDIASAVRAKLKE